MQKMMCVLLMVGLMLSASSNVLAQPMWQLGPVSQQMCSNIQGIMTGEEEIVYILTQLIDGKIDGTAAAEVVNKAQEHIRDEFINSLATIISQESSGSDLEYARSLLPNIRSTFSACDMRVNTFLTLKQIDKHGLQRVFNACSVTPEDLYNSYCQPPPDPQCADRGKQAGMRLWSTFKSSAGTALCEKLPEVDTELVKKLIERPATSCDDAFNNALSEYINQQKTQMKAECSNRLPTPTPTPNVPTSGLEAYYRFDFNGNILTDSSNNYHHGVIHGASPTSDRFGAPNSAYRFDGLDDSIDLGDWFDFHQFTISIWVNPGDTQNIYADIMDNNHVQHVNWVLQQAESNLNQYGFGVSSKDANDVGLGINLIAKKWQHVIIAIGDYDSRAYIDGRLISSVNRAPRTINYQDHYLRLGRWGRMDGKAGRYWNGSMDDLRIYRRAISEAEIQTIYESEKP